MKTESIRTLLLNAALLIAVVTIPASLVAQSAMPAISGSSASSSSDKPYRGVNAYETFRGVVTDSGVLLKLDSSVGYDFNRNFGVFAGVPFYFTNGFDTNTSASTLRASGLGDAYIGAELYTFSKVLRYSSSVTVGIPTGDQKKGFSPGKVTADWTNHFRRSFGRLTPAFSVGVGNTVGVGVGVVPGSDLVSRSLSATGTFLHMEEGADFDVTRRVYVGGAAYQIVPTKNDSTGAVSTSTNAIVRENGVDAWVGYQPNRIIRTEVGYSRSTTFALNSMNFKIGLNVGKLFRRNDSQY